MKKKPSGRRIVVDGVEYRWKAGTGMIEVRREGRVFLRVDTAKALGLSNDAHERAIHKRTRNGAVTPGLIAELIKEHRSAGRSRRATVRENQERDLGRHRR